MAKQPVQGSLTWHRGCPERPARWFCRSVVHQDDHSALSPPHWRARGGDTWGGSADGLSWRRSNSGEGWTSSWGMERRYNSRNTNKLVHVWQTKPYTADRHYIFIPRWKMTEWNGTNLPSEFCIGTFSTVWISGLYAVTCMSHTVSFMLEKE